ncbi:hypothetical protein [Methylobacterium sp. E-066]|uniref:hypothetical protein n=1 Tax=Methylobacterium sp. E-066 TaxID=2836584 RepID=UPI001FBB379F|nr:hypothetical protein [Methylobacterium sp. E-066]MCJ2143211.1 hypothetical protein [Methylobacterium sp. E-066]
MVWIDDYFNETPARLAAMLLDNVEVTQTCGFPEAEPFVELRDNLLEEAKVDLTEILDGAGAERNRQIKAIFFDALRSMGEAGKELSSSTIEKVCDLLDVKAADRWDFGHAFVEMRKLCAAGDAHVSYVVDLNNARGSKTEGVDILIALAVAGSKGTAFILTHDVTAAAEETKEIELRALIQEGATNPKTLDIPICVIAKERLADETTGVGPQEALMVAVKRAGLRRSVHEVLWHARDHLADAFEQAASGLVGIPADQLEFHVVDRAFKEGASELHVVERALTAHLSRSLRVLFGTQPEIQASAERMRSLRTVPLPPGDLAPDPRLADFRKAEVWESDDLINVSLAPITCGDVFEMDLEEQVTRAFKKKFLLLGQPCDISLRPGQSRQQDTGYLVFLQDITGKPKTRTDPKAPRLPFILDGIQYACDFRTATNVRLSILDLASFRPDGRVRVDAGHGPPKGMLQGQNDVYSARTSAADAALKTPWQRPPAGRQPVSLDPALQLTFSTGDNFKHVFRGVREPVATATPDGRTVAAPDRVTWRLRRCGRIRMPYAAALLDDYVSVTSRQAFDLDYLGGVGEGSPADPEPIEDPDLEEGLGI